MRGAPTVGLHDRLESHCHSHTGMSTAGPYVNAKGGLVAVTFVGTHRPFGFELGRAVGRGGVRPT